MANASITSETCRCQPCQERVSLCVRPYSVLAVSNASSIAQRCPSTRTSSSIGVPAGHQVEKNARSPSEMVRRIKLAFVITWSAWRRAHQAMAQASHRKRRVQL